MKHCLIALLIGAAATAACADELALPAPADAAVNAPSSESVAVPHKGETMQAVRHQFGEPQLKHAAVGGDAPRHPPITRWDYNGFSVFFEHAHVVDSVVPDRPPPVYHSEQLQAVSQ